MDNHPILLAGSNACQDPALRQAVQSLSSQPIVLARDLAEMRRLCLEQVFSLIILDTSIPINGEELTPPPLPPSTVILSIAEADKPNAPINSGHQDIYSDCINEPVTPSQLLSRLQPLLHIHRLRQQLLICQKDLQRAEELNNQWQRSAEHQKHYMKMLSIRDGLTGLYNRRHLARVLEEEMNRARETNNDLGLLLLDIDYFNQTNRVAGQLFGDSILNELSARLTQNTRDNDICFRFGGGDFIILLPGQGIDEAMEQAEKLRQVCANKPFTSGQHSRSVTVSIGVATLNAHCPKNLDEFISMADLAMFRAKAEGRNRVADYSSYQTPQQGQIHSIVLLQEMLARILEKTKTNSIASIQLLTQNLTGCHQDDHIQLASSYIQFLCGHLGLPDTLLATFGNALTLHSCYRQLLHRELLAKKEKFNLQERRELNDLPYKVAELTQHFDYFANERNMLLCQGERFDGTGYPAGLAGEEIPLASRIFSLADGLAAMQSDRPHRPRLTPEQMLRELVKGAGTQWDPSLVLVAIDQLSDQQQLGTNEQLLTQTRELIAQKITKQLS